MNNYSFYLINISFSHICASYCAINRCFFSITNASKQTYKLKIAEKSMRSKKMVK